MFDKHDVTAKKFDAIVEKVGLSDAECRMCCPWKFYGLSNAAWRGWTDHTWNFRSGSAM